MILGISAGGRKNGQTAAMVKMVVEESGLEHEFVSLHKKVISGCRGCLSCASSGVCVLKDDWSEIANKMFAADAIVFGAPIYSGTINATGHAFWERTYSLRHGRFKLGRIYGIIVTTGNEGNGASEFLSRMMTHNKMSILCKVDAGVGFAPCFHCGLGHECLAGHAIKKDSLGPINEITPEHYNNHFENNELAQVKIKRAGRILGAALSL